MFSRFLPLVIITGVLVLALGLLTYHPTSAAAQDRPGDSPFKLFDPASEPIAPANFTLFNVGDVNKTQAATGSDSPEVSSTLRISQVYTRGGEAGATYQNDFVEVFNAGNSDVDLNGWSMVVITFEGSTQQSKGATFNKSFMVSPGTHFLFRFAGNGTNGQPTPGDYAIITDTSLGSSSGQIMLLGPGQGLPSSTCPAGTSAVVDFVGYGNTTCGEGGGPVTDVVPGPDKSMTRGNGGCTDTDRNPVDFSIETPNPRPLSATPTPCLGSPSPAPTVSPTPNASPTPTPAPGTSTLRISQVYTRGGEAGATYQNDFVEVFNASSSTIDLNGWSMVVDTFEGSTNLAIGATFNQSFAVPPGMHILFRFNGNGSAGQATPGEFPITNISLGSTRGLIEILPPGVGYVAGCPPATGAVSDFVGYGTSTCSEGSPAPVPPSNKSLTRINGGCTDTNNNFNDFSLLDPAPRTTQSTPTPCGGTQPTPTPTPNASPTPTVSPTPNASPTPTPAPGTSTLRISQVYTRGGEAGATYQNDFVEVFNASSSTIDLNGWSMVVDTFEGSTNLAIGATFNQSFAVPPGMHILFRFNGNGSAGQATPGEFPITNISLGSTRGLIEILPPGVGYVAGCPPATGAVSDFVGYGTSTCSEGSPAPVPPSNKSLTRINGGCTDTNNNFNDFSLLDPAPRTTQSTPTPCGGTQPTPTPTPNASPTPTVSPTPTPSPGPTGTSLVISQVYTRGGEAGATFQNDFIEIFNASSSNVDINGWSLVVDTFEGSTNQARGATFNQSFPIAPGTHLLFRFAGNGTNGQATPGEFPIITDTSLGSTSGKLMLLAPGQTLPTGCPAAGAVADLVGYGSSTCSETSPAPVPPSNKSLLRNNGGCSDTNNNLNDFFLSDPNPRTFASQATPCGSTVPAGNQLNFSANSFSTQESGSARITVVRSGDLSGAATVDYATSDGTASERSDYTTTIGTLRFAAGESQKTFDVLITSDGLSEGNETVVLTLSNAIGNAGVGSVSSAQLTITDLPPSTGNLNDVSSDFVDQHYHDFLNRVPDASGLSFWTNNIESCGNDANCRLVKRVDTSAAFFLSIEFQKTGFLAYRLYKASLPATTARPRGFPRYREFVRDSADIGRGVIVGNTGYEQVLEANTVDFINRFVGRGEFLLNYPASLTSAQYVDKLVAQAGITITPDQRDFLVTGLNNGTETRATVLRRVAEFAPFAAAETNRAFVLMQYFGYLRRNPDDAPNSDFSGFDFWLGKLNQFNGDYKGAELVKAFITSSEYRNRFGQ